MVLHGTRTAAAVVGLLTAGLVPVGPARADTTIVVTTTANTTALDGGCSLREAIQAANENRSILDCFVRGGGYDRIEFALGGGTPVIDVGTTPLPEITSPVEIDGGPNRVELRGNGTGDGLTFSGAGSVGSVVRRLVIGGFRTGVRIASNSIVLVVGSFIGTNAEGDAGNPNLWGIRLFEATAVIGGTSGLTPAGPCSGDCNLISANTGGGVYVDAGSNAFVYGNYVGTDRTGTQSLGNGFGVDVGQSIATIGGVGAGNLVSGNTTGIQITIAASNAAGSVIQGNRVGTDATGAVPLANGTGIRLSLNNRAYPVTLGGAAAGAGNLVSGNTGDGIHLDRADSVLLHGNRIGTRDDGVTPLPNGVAGIRLGPSAHANQIVGIGSGEGNTIAWNAVGVAIDDGYHNTVRGNSIHDNVGKGIALANGQSGMAPAPPFLVGGSIIIGTTCGSCVVDLYSELSDEGRIWEGWVQADAAGDFAFTGPLSGPYVTATAMAPLGSTSEFSSPAAYDGDGDGAFDPFDNCPYVANDQSDVGGVGASGPDGIGDACQCGDLDADGDADLGDAALLRGALADPAGAALPPAALEHCSVSGDPLGCDVLDASLLVRANAALAPPLAQGCSAALL
jgi:CSLREA domain-containing protein